MEPDPKHPLSSKTVLALLPVILTNGVDLVSFLMNHHDQLDPTIAMAKMVIPPQYLLPLNMLFAGLGAAFRIYSSGVRLERGAPFTPLK